MAKAWAFVLVSLLAAAFLNLAFAGAQALEVTMLPDDKIVSANSDIVIKVNPQTDQKSVRITWSVYDTGNIGIGSLPLVGGNGICYFSNSDGNATCGPTPFFQTGETSLDIYVVTPAGPTNKTITLNVSSVSIPMSEVIRQDNSVYMNIYMGKMDTMTYSIYNENLSIYQSNRQLDYDAVHGGKYAGNITLNPGVYYFTFIIANGTSTYGSALKRIDIPSADFLTIQTGRKDYWKGDKINISGISSPDSVVGEVRFPNGSKALDFAADVSGGGAFSYEFYSQNGWPEGAYEIRTSKPLVKNVTFTITDFLEIKPASVSRSVNKSSAFSASVSLKNIRDNATNVSFAVSGDLKAQYVAIANRTLDPQQSTALSISIPDVESGIDGKITLKTTEGLELAIPVHVTVVEAGGQTCPPPTAAGKALEIDQDSLVWSQECMAGEEIRHSVKIKNNGASALSDFKYGVEDSSAAEQSLKDLDEAGDVDVPVSDVSIGAGESKEIEIKLTPSSAGKYEGLITLSSGDESAFVFVSLSCFGNITGDLSAVSGKLAEISPAKDISDDINSDVKKAQDALALGNYALANEHTVRAQAKITMLETGGVSKPMDFTWIMIIGVVVVVAVVFLLFFRSRKSKGGGAEEEAEELESFA
jgi:hypothetical protein